MYVCVCVGGGPSFKQHWSWLTAIPRWDWKWGLRMMFCHCQPPTCPHSHRHAHRDSLSAQSALACPLALPLLQTACFPLQQSLTCHSQVLSSKNSCLYPSEHKTQVRGPCGSSHSANSKTQCLVLYLEVSPLIH